MQTFSRGQKGKLSAAGLSDKLQVSLSLTGNGLTLDMACFALDAGGKLSDDRYMVFYNQPRSPLDAIILEQSQSGSLFKLDLQRLPATIERLVFTAALDGNGTLAQLGGSSLRLDDAIEFPFAGSDFQQEKAVIIGELYRRDGEWRFGAVGQGFNGGLSALLTHFGGAEATPAPTPAPVIPPAPAPVTPSVPAAKVSLSKITLEKRGDKISLEKRGNSFGTIKLNLNWSRTAPRKTGFLDKLRGNTDIDLDLGCLYELANGQKGAVQALGETWGNFEQAPFIKLQADDRSGASQEGENILINGQQFDKISRILVYAFIYQGVPNWAATDGVVTIEAPGQAPVEVRLDLGENKMMCAIAGIDNRNGELYITKLVEYFSGSAKVSAHEEMDRRFGFGMQWAAGRK